MVGEELMRTPLESRRLLQLGRWLVSALALAMLSFSLVGVVLFPRYVAGHLDAPAFTPNESWTPEQVQAGLAELGWPAATVGWVALGRDLVILAVAGTLALLLLRRRADSWFGLFVALVFVVMMAAATPLAALGAWVPGLARLNVTLGAVSWQLFFILFFLFPDGRPVPGWTRWLAYGWGAFVVAQVVRPDAWGLFANPIISQLFFGVVIVAIGSQVYRYLRRSDAIQRQQTKWVVFALMIALVSILLAATVGFREPDPARLGPHLVVALSLWVLFGLTFALVPAAIGVAILRYRLWDVDVIIRRTLVYAIVTGVLVAVYLGGVVTLQTIFVRLTGQASTLAVVASTLAIAALFQPLRRTVQRVIDRRFDRTHYDAHLVLERFAHRAQHEADLDALSADLLATVDETLKPSEVRLWLTRR